MGWFKNICTCVGCIAGAACVIITGGTGSAVVVPLLLASGAGGIAGNLVGHQMDQEEKKVKNQEKDLELRSQTIESLKKDNERLQADRGEKQNEYKKQEQENQQKEKELEDAKGKANDPNLSEEDRRYWRNRVIVLEDELKNGKGKSQKLLNEIKNLEEQIKNNNKNITSVGSSSSSGKGTIMEFFTLQNVLIVFAVYALWQIVIKDDRR